MLNWAKLAGEAFCSGVGGAGGAAAAAAAASAAAMRWARGMAKGFTCPRRRVEEGSGVQVETCVVVLVVVAAETLVVGNTPHVYG